MEESKLNPPSYKTISHFPPIHWDSWRQVFVLRRRWSTLPSSPKIRWFPNVAQFSSFSHVQLFATPMDCSMTGLPVHHQLLEFSQTHVHGVGDAIQPSHPLLPPSPPAFNLSQHQGLFRWVSSSHQVAKILEFQLQHQSFQWIFRTDFL